MSWQFKLAVACICAAALWMVIYSLYQIFHDPVPRGRYQLQEKELVGGYPVWKTVQAYDDAIEAEDEAMLRGTGNARVFDIHELGVHYEP